MNVRLILVEDDRTLRGVLYEWSRRHGYEVREFSSGEDVCSHHETCQCDGDEVCADALLCERTLSGMSGLDLVGELWDSGGRIPRVALMSGWWTDFEWDRAKGLGLETFRKPTDFSALLQWLGGAADERPDRRQLRDHFHADHT